MPELAPKNQTIASTPRSAAAALVQKLRDADRETAQTIQRQLLNSDAPSSVSALMALIEDDALDASIRNLCSDTLLDLENAWSANDETLQRWWDSGDLPLMRHALGQMGPKQGDIIDSVLSDHNHPLLRDAISTLVFDFDDVALLPRTLPFFRHTKPEIRAEVSKTLLTAEPFAAMDPLIQACEDMDASVASGAFQTLCYYPSVAVFEQAERFSTCSNEAIADSASNCLFYVSEDLRGAAKASPRLTRWLTRILARLDTSELVEDLKDESVDTKPEPPKREYETSWTETFAAFEEYFDPDDARWNTRRSELRTPTWNLVPEAERARFVRGLLRSPEAYLRSVATRAFAAWGKVDAILELMNDPCAIVRKSATYNLRHVPRSDTLAARAFTVVDKGKGYARVEAFETGVALSLDSRWQERAESIAKDKTESESLRYASVHSLRKAKAKRRVANLLFLLEEPPDVSWALHDALVEAGLELGLKMPDLSHLDEVDHLCVQQFLSEVDER